MSQNMEIGEPAGSHKTDILAFSFPEPLQCVHGFFMRSFTSVCQCQPFPEQYGHGNNTSGSRCSVWFSLIVGNKRRILLKLLITSKIFFPCILISGIHKVYQFLDIVSHENLFNFFVFNANSQFRFNGHTQFGYIHGVKSQVTNKGRVKVDVGIMCTQSAIVMVNDKFLQDFKNVFFL